MAKRLTGFTRAKQAEFLDHLRQGMRRGAATDAVFGGDDPSRRRQMREWILDHPEFEAAVLDAEVEATEHVEEALYQAAISGSVPAAKAWIDLKGRKPDESGANPVAPPAPGAPAPEPGEDDLFNVAVLDPRKRRQS